MKNTNRLLLFLFVLLVACGGGSGGSSATLGEIAGASVSVESISQVTSQSFSLKGRYDSGNGLVLDAVDDNGNPLSTVQLEGAIDFIIDADRIGLNSVAIALPE